jgi:LAO/AO transport system kinase
MSDVRIAAPAPAPAPVQGDPAAMNVPSPSRGTIAGATPAQLLEAARSGDRVALARLLSLVERGGESAREISRISYPLGGRSYTVGITGAPGAGKSTLTNGIISAIRSSGAPVGVIAIDPSSPFSGGAILGDRVRMQDHALDRDVFIRSMASRGHLGGLSLAVPEALRLLDAAGWPLVLVETVGVGQVEVEVAGTCDTTVVVLNPGWGDSVQANKAGLLEVADVFVINKADRPGLREARRDLKQMLQMSHMTAREGADPWMPPVVTSIATSGEGVAEAWDAIVSHRAHLEETGLLARRREERLAGEVRRIITAEVGRIIGSFSHEHGPDAIRQPLVSREADPYEMASRLLDEVVRSLASARAASRPSAVAI